MMIRITILYIFITSSISAINPPQQGTIPDSVLQLFRYQEIGDEYGNPGWIKKLQRIKKNKQNRNEQLYFNIPVLLGKYSDQTQTYFTASDFNQLLFDNNPTGTMTEYFNEISYGMLEVDGFANGWYQSSMTMSEAVQNTKLYVSEIAAMADPDFNYAEYDNDGPDNIPNSGDDDGYVDGIIVVYSGCGAEWRPSNGNIWPHQSSLGQYEYITNDIGANGTNIIVSTYTVNPELSGGGDCFTDLIRPIGVYAHEFGHILGLPDLYDRDGGSEGVGNWCLMAGGSWLGFAGDTPAHMSAWCKIQMGWVDPIEINHNSSGVIIRQLATNPSVIKIWEDDFHWNRYFLIENRQKIGFDYYLNGDGLLVYHIDENRSYGANAWSGGPVNNDELHKLVDIEEADGLNDLDNQINRGDSGDPFPGQSDNRTFNQYSDPSSNRYDNSVTSISLENISNSDSIMFVDIEYQPKSGYAIAYDTMGMSYYGFGNSVLSDKWSAVEFEAQESGYLTEVDFGVRYPMNWEVQIYDSFDGSSPGTILKSISGYSEQRGWVSTPIDSLSIAEGQLFFIAIRYLNETYSVSYDNGGPLSGRSYYSDDGVNFSNILSSYGNANIRAKIRTNNIMHANSGDLLPDKFKLDNNYPNPFNPVTSLRYDLPEDGLVNITIYDMMGRIVKTLVNSSQTAGYKTIRWNATNDRNEPVSAGLYLYTIQAGEFRQTKKMVLIK